MTGLFAWYARVFTCDGSEWSHSSCLEWSRDVFELLHVTVWIVTGLSGHIWQVQVVMCDRFWLVTRDRSKWSHVTCLSDHMWHVWMVACDMSEWSHVTGLSGHMWQVWIVTCNRSEWSYVTGLSGHMHCVFWSHTVCLNNNMASYNIILYATHTHTHIATDRIISSATALPSKQQPFISCIYSYCIACPKPSSLTVCLSLFSMDTCIIIIGGTCSWHVSPHNGVKHLYTVIISFLSFLSAHRYVYENFVSVHFV